jgi:hypothetical protein
MTQKKAFERWELKIGNCYFTPRTMWHIVKSLIKRDEPRTPTAIHGPLGLKYQSLDKATTVADYLENQLTSHYTCGAKYKRSVEASA